MNHTKSTMKELMESKWVSWMKFPFELEESFLPMISFQILSEKFPKKTLWLALTKENYTSKNTTKIETQVIKRSISSKNSQ